MFSRYTMVADASLASAGWASVKDASTRMSERGLVAWATDYHVVPDMIPRPHLIALAKEAARACVPAAAAHLPPHRPPRSATLTACPLTCPRSIGRRDGGADLGYPEFIELIGLIAYELGDARLLGMRKHLLSTTGVVDDDDMPAALPMLTKLHLLFSNMLDNGAKFEGDAYKIVRAALEGLRRSAHEAQRAAGRNAAATDNGQRRRVQAVLSETVMA